MFSQWQHLPRLSWSNLAACFSFTLSDSCCRGFTVGGIELTCHHVAFLYYFKFVLNQIPAYLVSLRSESDVYKFEFSITIPCCWEVNSMAHLPKMIWHITCRKKSWFNFDWLKQIKIFFSLTFELFVLSISFWISGDPLDQLLCLLSAPFLFHMSETVNSFSMGRRGRRQQYHLGMTFWEQTLHSSPKEEFLKLSLPEVSMCLRAQTCNATQNMYPCLILWHVCFSEKKPKTKQHNKPWQFYIYLICLT